VRLQADAPLRILQAITDPAAVLSITSFPSSGLLLFKELRVRAVSLALQLVVLDEAKGGRVHAVSQPALVALPIREAMAEVVFSVLGADLGPRYALRAVNVLDDVCLERPHFFLIGA